MDQQQHPADMHGQQRGIKWDPTINAGHLVTFIGLLITIIGAWATIDRRVGILEEAKGYQAKRDELQDQAVSDKLTDIKQAIRDVKQGIDALQQRKP